MEPEAVDRQTAIANHEDVEMLRRCMIDLELCRESGPNALFVVIHRQAWMHRVDPDTGERVDLRPHEFRRFITEKPRIGLGQDFGEMQARFCGDDPLLLEEWDKATVGKPGGLNNPHGRAGKPITVSEEINPSNRRFDSAPEPHHGTTAQYALRRLRTHAPELHARVLAGDLSPNRAMIEAGFRDRMVQVPLVPEKAARVLRRHFDADQLRFILKLALDANADAPSASGGA